MAKIRGHVNFTSLKGLNLYKQGIQILSKNVEVCDAKYQTHLKLATIPAEFKDLCLQVSKKH